MAAHPTDSIVIHATTVSLAGNAALIRGASGSGKSALALRMIALGAGLIADDRTCLTRAARAIVASAPAAIAGQIEARGVGILNVPAAEPCRVTLIVDMNRTEMARLPAPKTTQLLDAALPEIGKIDADYFPAALCLYLQHGRVA